MSKAPGADIVSLHNPRVKLAASLAQRKFREERGLVLVEGERLVDQALAFGAEFLFFLIDERRVETELLRRLVETGAETLRTNEAVMRRASDTTTPQGVLGVARAVAEDAVDLTRARFLVVAEGLQDPGNLGAVMRVATAVGADGLVTTQGTVDPKHPRVIRASAGAYFHVPLRAGCDPAQLGLSLRQSGFEVVVADASGEEDAFSFPWQGQVAIVIGSEARGARPELGATKRVRIPMPGGGESLNAGVAAGILLYQAWHARQGGQARL